MTPDKKSILTLDLGTATGWAFRDQSGTITSGTMTFKPSRFEGGGMRFVRFGHWVRDFSVAKSGLGTVYFEEVRRHLGVDAAHAYGGFMAHLTAICEQNQVPYLGVPVGTIKKHATGKGNASKAEVTDAMLRKGHRPRDDNEADALALMYFVLEQENG